MVSAEETDEKVVINHKVVKMDYENCNVYQIKKPVDGICIGNDDGKYDEKCENCPAYLRHKEMKRKL